MSSDELLAGLELIECEVAEVVALLDQRQETTFAPLLARLRLDTLLHGRQLERARTRLEREGIVPAPRPSARRRRLGADGSTGEVLLALKRGSIAAYEAALKDMEAPMALRGMLSACLADERMHRAAIASHLGVTVPRRHTGTRRIR